MLLNKVQLVTFPHVVLSAYMTGGAFVVGVVALEVRRAARATVRETFRRSVRTGASVLLVAGIGVAISGDVSGQDHDRGPADEDGGGRGSLRHRRPRAVLDPDPGQPERREAQGDHRDPRAALVPRHRAFNGEIKGIDDLRAEYKSTYGYDPGAKYYSPGDYTPIIPVTYWTLPAS